MSSTTLASIAAATAAGYVLQRIDNDGKYAQIPSTARFETRLSRYLTGQDGEGGFTMEARATGTTQAGADTAALAALNAQRIARYGADTTALNKDIHGKNHTVDKT